MGKKKSSKHKKYSGNKKSVNTLSKSRNDDNKKHAKKKDRFFKIYSFLLIMIFLVLPFIVSLFDKPNEFSGENITAETFVNYDDFIVNAADSFIKTVNELTTHESYITGNDNNHLFLNTGDGVNEQEYIDMYCEFTSKLQEYCNSRNIDFLYQLDPGKSIVYSEYYDYDDIDREKRNQYIINTMKDNGVNCLYTLSSLLRAKNERAVYNTKYDAGHWNDNGAYAAISSSIEHLLENNENILPPSLSNYNIYETVYTAVPHSRVPIIETGQFYALENKLTSIPINKYDSEVKVIGHDAYTHHINTKQPLAPKLLIFGGSYIEGKEKFYSPSFSEVIYIKSYFNIINYEYYINLFQPDAVIFESADYVMNNNFIPYDDMKNTVNTAPYLLFSDYSETLFALPTNLNINTDSDIATVSLKTLARNPSHAYLIAGDTVYNCSVYVNMFITNISTNVILDDIKNKPLHIALISEDEQIKQTIRMKT